MREFLPVGRLEEVPENSGRLFSLLGREVAVFRVAGEVYAIDNACPHLGGPLVEGELKGKLLTCPWHAWSFDLQTNKCTLNPAATLKSFETRVESGVILVRV